MDKKEIQKNVLDLKHQMELQKIHASLTTLTVGILAFLGTFIWYIDRFFFGIAISSIVILVSLIFYFTAKIKINRIILDIEKISI